MDAREAGFGYVVPMPRCLSSYLGHIIYMDDEGVVRSTGSVFDDIYFKQLVEDSRDNLDRTTTEEEYPYMTVGFTTGCVNVSPMAEEDVLRSSLYLRTFSKAQKQSAG